MIDYITHQIITLLIVIFLLLSMLHQIIIGFLYQNMLKAAENMSSTKHKLLNQCKMQFSMNYQLHNGRMNTFAYVERFINKMKIGKIRIESLSHISGQLMLLSVFFAGVGICKSLADGLSVSEIVPYYFISFFGLYLYFSLASFINIMGKKELLKITLVDFLENRMVSRLNFNMTDEIAQNEWNSIQNTSFMEENLLEVEEIANRTEIFVVVEEDVLNSSEKINEEISVKTKEEELAILLHELLV